MSVEQLVDLRPDYQNEYWHRGRLLKTASVSRWTLEQQEKAQYIEKCCVFVGFSEYDEGKSRIKLWEFKTPEECLQAVEEHNKALRIKILKEAPQTWENVLKQVGFMLECLTATIPDGNEHIIRKADKVMSVYRLFKDKPVHTCKFCGFVGNSDIHENCDYLAVPFVKE